MKTYPKPQQGLSPKNFLLSDFLSKDEVFHIARVSITSSKDLSFHSHNYAELLWIESGEGIHHINGYNLPIRKNDMVMIRPQDKHNFTAKGKQLTLVNIAFPKESLDYFRCRYFPKTSLYFWTKSPLPFQMTLPDELIRRISTKAEETMLCKRSYLQLDSLLLFIFQQISINESALNYTDAPLWLVNAIQEFNKAGVYKDGSALFISLCNRNADYVNRIIKIHFHTTLTEFINNIRIKHAASQLLLTNIPIKSICDSCGFTSMAYFYKKFNEQYEVSPQKYREIHRKMV